MSFDIIILSHKKDYNKIPFLVKSVRENIVGFEDIHVISPLEIEDKIDGVHYHTDNEALPLNDETRKLWDEWVVSGIFTRQSPNWIFQQFIKLFQTVTNKDYLIVDSDIIFIKKIDIISEEKPNFFLGINQCNGEYFTFMKNILSLGKEINWSFICELMFFKKDVIKHMLTNFDGDYNNFIKRSISLINNTCFISEFELYGNYTMKNFPTEYNFKKLNCCLGGKHSEWSTEEIVKNMEAYKDSEYDIISIHSWC